MIDKLGPVPRNPWGYSGVPAPDNQYSFQPKSSAFQYGNYAANGLIHRDQPESFSLNVKTAWSQ